MGYQEFVDTVTDIVGTSGETCAVVFEHDDDLGLHIARLSNGLVIIGNSTSLKLTVRGMNGFQAQFEPE